MDVFTDFKAKNNSFHYRYSMREVLFIVTRNK